MIPFELDYLILYVELGERAFGCLVDECSDPLGAIADRCHATPAGNRWNR